MIDDEQGSFRAARGCVDQIFTLKQIGKKAREKKRRMKEVKMGMGRRGISFLEDGREWR